MTLTGTVLAAHRRHFAVALDDGARIDCVLKGRSASLACGDRVEVNRVAGGGSIERVLPRTNLIYRSDAFKEKLIAANVTQLIGVVAPDLPVDLELVDRWSVAAEAERCTFVIIANKADLDGAQTLLERLQPWRKLGYHVLPLSAKRDIDPLRAIVEGQHSVLVGQSGMGKSTMLNALSPEVAARTAEISTALASGRHTTTGTTLYPLDGESMRSWIVDSPGMTAFALAHLEPHVIAEAFVEVRPCLGHCRFRDCRHDQEPGCAVQDAVERGDIAPHRVALMHTLIADSEAARDPARR
ncbi:MAG TPA: ribosome small subunit-dependent GTPase A [Casimicrobiaceae bacterium]|nr:ribosome small subunit-dependent GTPase A [Casimicrobiaceae bacterium]